MALSEQDELELLLLLEAEEQSAEPSIKNALQASVPAYVKGGMAMAEGLQALAQKGNIPVPESIQRAGQAVNKIVTPPARALGVAMANAEPQQMLGLSAVSPQTAFKQSERAIAATKGDFVPKSTVEAVGAKLGEAAPAIAVGAVSPAAGVALASLQQAGDEGTVNLPLLASEGIGQVAKAGLKGVKALKGENAFTAALQNPELISSRAQQKAFKDLERTTSLLMRKDPVELQSKFIQMTSTPGGQQRLVSSTREALAKGEVVPNTQLLAAREAAGKLQARGGSFAPVAKRVKKQVTQLLEEQAPGYGSKVKKVATVFDIEGKPDVPVSLIKAVFNKNPLTSAAPLLAPVKRAAGALTRRALDIAAPFAPATPIVGPLFQAEK